MEFGASALVSCSEHDWLRSYFHEGPCAGRPLKSDDLSSTWQRRDPLKQPFASSSIWNLPLGAGAQYKPMQLEPMYWEGSRDAGRLVPLTEATRNIINADVLAAMKPTASLINTARQAMVDEAALAAALADGTIGGAALDVKW